MTGRHATASDIDDLALAELPREPGTHRADVDPAAQPAPGDTEKTTARRRAAPQKETP
jgi:hypothetical protein